MSYEIVSHDTPTEWLAARRDGIGASDIAGILGISPWTTPFQVWASKVAELPEDMDNEAMAWGQILEGVILDEWERRTGLLAMSRGAMVRNTERPFMLATPDARAVDPDTLEDVATIDAKNSHDYSWDEPPNHYAAQVQWQLAVTGLPLGLLVVLHRGRRLATYEIEADTDRQAEMVSAATDFWKLVDANEPPPVDGEDNAFLSTLWPTHTEQAVEVGQDRAIELYEARSAHKAATGRKNAAEAAIKAELGEADTAVVDQKVVATWRESNGTRYFRVRGETLYD